MIVDFVETLKYFILLSGQISKNQDIPILKNRKTRKNLIINSFQEYKGNYLNACQQSCFASSQKNFLNSNPQKKNFTNSKLLTICVDCHNINIFNYLFISFLAFKFLQNLTSSTDTDYYEQNCIKSPKKCHNIKSLLHGGYII